MRLCSLKKSLNAVRDFFLWVLRNKKAPQGFIRRYAGRVPLPDLMISANFCTLST